MWWAAATGRSLDDHSGWCESACRTLTRHRSKRPSQRLRRERAPRFAMPCHIPGSRASNLRLQRKSLDLPELVLVRFALRHESTRSRTARLGKGVAKDCSFAISKINAGDRDDKPEQNRVAGKELGVASKLRRLSPPLAAASKLCANFWQAAQGI